MTHEDFTQVHEMIDACATSLTSACPQRPCPECGMVCTLTRGRFSGKWMFTHLYPTDCIHDRVGARVLHDTKESAMTGQMFHST